MIAIAIARIATLGLASRSFLFVPYGEAVSPSLAASGPTISCDGRVPGSTLELTHWTANVTPRPLYADTSTECALRLAHACARGEACVRGPRGMRGSGRGDWDRRADGKDAI